ncbi:hypothetical protein [Methanimicrococcus hacksteinii]|uniref:hypothetical protein n=1 Tax=Methanimicrococcus hacksteinii TaxID=3028293 RepID=UPI00298EF415|nr:hypothetical protein [Methanimicrococcus sp. At1]
MEQKTKANWQAEDVNRKSLDRPERRSAAMLRDYSSPNSKTNWLSRIFKKFY